MNPLRLFLLIIFIAFAAAVPWPPLAAADETVGWTLESVVRRTLQTAPEVGAADAEVASREAESRQAGAWPNPTIDLRTDGKPGWPSLRRGADSTQLEISQPLPLRRLARQRAAAGAALEAARESRGYRRLLMEREAARAFHALQIAKARRELSRQRLALAQEYAAPRRRDPLVRYLGPVERQRLAILKEEANQLVLTAEAEHGKALAEFRALLALPSTAAVETAPPGAPGPPPALEAMERALETHPLLAAAAREAEAARAGIAVVEAQRFADIEIKLFRDRDVTGVGLSMPVPIWNQNQGLVAKARAEAQRAEAELAVRRRDALTRLRQSHAELTRLLVQAERLRPSLIEPAREVLDLTRRGFAAGETNILALVDANNTYFDAQLRYLELLMDSLLAADDLRLAAGLSVAAPEETHP